MGKWGKFPEYILEYNKKHYVNFSFRLRNDSEIDAKIIDFLKNKENKTDYLRSLVADDMKKKKLL